MSVVYVLYLITHLGPELKFDYIRTVAVYETQQGCERARKSLEDWQPPSVSMRLECTPEKLIKE